MSTEQNPQDRPFDPDPDTADVSDRDDGPEPVDETEGTVRDPAGARRRPDDVTAVSSPAASDDPIDRIDEPRGVDEGGRGEGDRRADDLDRQSRRSATDLAAASDVTGEQLSDGVPGGEETPDGEDAGALLPGAQTDRLRIRWREVQLGFVDDPRQAVDDAAELVSTAVDQVATLLRDQVGALDLNRSSGDTDGRESETERLRTLMQRYHALLDRMLAV